MRKRKHAPHAVPAVDAPAKSYTAHGGVPGPAHAKHVPAVADPAKSSVATAAHHASVRVKMELTSPCVILDGELSPGLPLYYYFTLPLASRL